MIFKNRIKKFLLYLFGLYLIFSFLLNIIVDPYGKFNLISIDGFNKHKYNYEQVSYLKKAIEDKKINTLIFGTSRSAILGDEEYFQQNNRKVLNLSDGLYGNPKDIYNFLKYYININNNIKEIFIGIDLHVYQRKNNIEKIKNYIFYKAPNVSYFLYSLIKLSPIYNYLSFYNIRKNFNSELPLAPQDEYGIRKYFYKTLKGKEEELNFNKKTVKLIYGDSDLKNFKKIKEFGEANNIQINFFTFPNSIWYYQNSYSYKDVNIFYQELSKYITFYNFSYINRYTKDPNNYHNISHHTKIFNNLILNCITEKKEFIKIDDEFICKYIEEKDN